MSRHIFIPCPPSQPYLSCRANISEFKQLNSGSFGHHQAPFHKLWPWKPDISLCSPVFRPADEFAKETFLCGGGGRMRLPFSSVNTQHEKKLSLSGNNSPFFRSWQHQIQTRWKYRRSIWPNIYARPGFNSPVMALGHLLFPDVKAQHFSSCLWQQEAPQTGENHFMYCAYEGEHYVWYRGAAEVFILSLLESISVYFSLCFY